MSGEVSTSRTQIQEGPRGSAHPAQPFTARQLARLDEALTLGSRESGLAFSLYVGELTTPTRAHAAAQFAKLTDDDVHRGEAPAPQVLKRLPRAGRVGQHAQAGDDAADQIAVRE